MGGARRAARTPAHRGRERPPGVHRLALDLVDQIHAPDEVAPLIIAADLKRAAEAGPAGSERRRCP